MLKKIPAEISVEMSVDKFFTDLDGTLTFFPGIPGKDFLGNPLSPAESTQPMSKWTQKLVQLIFTDMNVPAVIITGNSPENAENFLKWAKIPGKPSILSAFYTDTKLELYRNQLQQLQHVRREEEDWYVYVAEDSSQLLHQLLLEFPEHVIPIPCYQKSGTKKENVPLPRKLADFLGHSDPNRLDLDAWYDFLEDAFDQFDPEPWIQIKKLTGSNKATLGTQYITIKHRQTGKALFRIRMSDWMVLRPTGKTELADIWEFKPST